MTALLDNRLIDSPGAPDAVPVRMTVPVAAAVLIFVGAIVVTDALGNAAPGAASGVGLVAAGVSVEKADNSTGAAGDITVDIARGQFILANSAGTDAITIADRHKPCFVADDQTVARTSNNGNRAFAGIVRDVTTDGVTVEVGVAPSTAQGVDIELVAAADLSAKKGFLIKVDGAGKAALAVLGEFCVGVLLNAPALNAIAKVRIAGLAQVITAGATAKGTIIESDAAGKAKAVVLSSGAGITGGNAIGIQLETGAADTLTMCVITQAGALPTTLA